VNRSPNTKMKNQLKQNLSGIVTGASSGIGRAIAILLAKKYKARLILNARSESDLKETAKLVQSAGGEAFCLCGDIAKDKLAARLIDQCVSAYGSIDLLVNNAGFARPGKLTSLSVEDWQNVFAVNFFAPLESIYQALPIMLHANGGKIVNIASVAGKIAFPGSVCYSASKFALTGMSEGMAAELASKNIDIITVCPGWVRSEFFSKNHMTDDNNPTKISDKNNWQGWLMRNVLSISSENCAKETLNALEKGGSQEIVLTLPGIFAERINAFFPNFLNNVVGRVRSL
jgi:short-subunit dehydrogenase